MNFDGVIREFPFICVDNFSINSSISLLTHAHADHLIGFSNKSFFGEVFCSKETKTILEQKTRFKKHAKFLKTIPLNEPYYFKEKDIRITLVPANHCLGAVMFLIESPTKNILITGDLRCEPWWCSSLGQNPFLFPYINGLKSLDNIYFDSTFAYRGEPYIEIPPNNAGVYMAISLLKEYPRDDPEINFCFKDTVLGFDQAWAFILSYFAGALAVNDDQLKESLEIVSKLDHVHGPPLLLAMKKYQKGKTKGGVFYVGQSIGNEFSVSIKQCINFNVRDLAGACCPIKLSSIPSLELPKLQLLKETALRTKIYRFRDRLWLLPPNGTELLPQEIKLIFSRHSSYSEIHEFLSLFCPKQVYPCVDNKKNYMNGFTMKRLFGDVCKKNESFLYDEEQKLSHSGASPPKIVMDRPVATINRWDPCSCTLEQHIMTTEQPALIDLRKVAHAAPFKKDQTRDEQNFTGKRKKDFALQRLVEGRREITYKKFIEEQQMLYYKKHNLPQYAGNDGDDMVNGSSNSDSDSWSSSGLMIPRRTPAENDSPKSLILASPDSLQKIRSINMKMPSPVKKRKLQRSFVQSSFASLEESLPKKGDTTSLEKCKKNILIFLEKSANQFMIDGLSRDFLVNPKAWQFQTLQSIMR